MAKKKQPLQQQQQKQNTQLLLRLNILRNLLNNHFDSIDIETVRNELIELRGLYTANNLTHYLYQLLILYMMHIILAISLQSPINYYLK